MIPSKCKNLYFTKYITVQKTIAYVNISGKFWRGIFVSNKQNEQIAINFAKSMWIALYVIAKKIAFFYNCQQSDTNILYRKWVIDCYSKKRWNVRFSALVNADNFMINWCYKGVDELGETKFSFNYVSYMNLSGSTPTRHNIH